MGAKESFERAFRQLVADKPYAKITVTEICRKAHLSRKAFYDNFQDKEGVLEAIIDDALVKPIVTMNDLLTKEQAKSMMSVYMENIYVAIFDDKDFYQALVRPMKGVDDTFIRVVTHRLERLNGQILSDLDTGTALEREYAAYFFAASQAMLLQKWIFDGMPLAPKELGLLYRKMNDSYWMSMAELHY